MDYWNHEFEFSLVTLNKVAVLRWFTSIPSNINHQPREYCSVRRPLVHKAKASKFEDFWSEGLWVGVDMRSGENMIGTDAGVVRVSTIKRKRLDSRWSYGRTLTMKGCPKEVGRSRAGLSSSPGLLSEVRF